LDVHREGVGMGKVACGGWIAATLAIGSLAGPAFGADSERAVRAAGVAHDGPFGIAMGEPLSEVGPVEEIAPALYHVLAPPRANQDLTYVAVVAYPETGVCEIEGRGPKARLDPKGVQVRTTVNQIAEALIDKYGPYSQKTEYCNRLELCDSYWVAELKNGDAKLESRQYLLVYA
jgi:hypothetical protein